MNQYGHLASLHWQRHRPAEYAQIPDPAAWFTALGEEISAKIDSLAAELAGDDPPDENYRDKAARLGTARHQAESMTLTDLLYLRPEAGRGDGPELVR